MHQEPGIGQARIHHHGISLRDIKSGIVRHGRTVEGRADTQKGRPISPQPTVTRVRIRKVGAAACVPMGDTTRPLTCSRLPGDAAGGGSTALALAAGNGVPERSV
jgi:hypothetical protein